jgi:hypothetical protein
MPTNILRCVRRFELYNGHLQGTPEGPICLVADVAAALGQGPATSTLRYLSPEEHRTLDVLDALRGDLQALAATVPDLPGLDADAAGRAVRGAQKHLVQLAALVQAAGRR